MARRPQGTKFWAGGSVSAQISSTPGQIYSICLSWRAATAGDRIRIVDGTTDGGTTIEEIIISTANVDCLNVRLPAVGKYYATGLRYVAPGDSNEVNISIGYDGA